VENVDKLLLLNVSHGTTTMKVVYTAVDEIVDNCSGCELIITRTQVNTFVYTD
jgi:hypothetical protein